MCFSAGGPRFTFSFVAAKEFVALDGGDHARRRLSSARLGALHAAEAADAYRSGQSDLVGQSQQNLERGEPSRTSLERKK